MSVSSLPSLEIITLIMTSSLLQSKLNTNRYATKKTIAQGMLDIALLSSNAAQMSEFGPMFFNTLALVRYRKNPV